MSKRRSEWKPPKIPAAEDLKRLLRARYDERKGWILLLEVRNGTGYARSARYADALALNVWPSAGLVLHGFEIKVSRNDLHRELREEGKDEIKQHCDRWWLVVPSADLLDGFELPADWGVLIPERGMLKAHREAPERPRSEKGWPRSFAASLVRNAAEGGLALVDAQAAAAGAEERGAERERERVKRQLGELQELRHRVQEFTRAANEHCFEYMAIERVRELGKLLATVKLEGNAAGARARILEQLERAAAALREAP